MIGRTLIIPIPFPFPSLLTTIQVLPFSLGGLAKKASYLGTGKLQHHMGSQKGRNVELIWIDEGIDHERNL